MKAARYLWLALSVLFCLVGMYVLLDSIRHEGPYADEYVLLGATLTALGLASLAVQACAPYPEDLRCSLPIAFAHLQYPLNVQILESPER